MCPDAVDGVAGLALELIYCFRDLCGEMGRKEIYDLVCESRLFLFSSFVISKEMPVYPLSIAIKAEVGSVNSETGPVGQPSS